MANTKGTKVGKYLITSKIAEGGMGAIYKAKHPTLHRDVILKRLTLRQNASITERFKREAQLMIDFRDDRIVQVYDHFKEGNSYYIAMEFIDGISLDDLIKKKRYIPNDIAILLFSEISKALKYAHDKNVIHRDIKPANILVSKDGEVKLTDFGIARSKESDDEAEGLTSDGMTLGTPAYMSPEQISDTKSVDKKADIYSMGVVLYEMVTGKCPFPGTFTPEAIALIQKGEYLPPKRINPRVAPVIQKIIKKAMHCKAKKRYKDLKYIIAILSKSLRKYRDQESVNQTIKSYLISDEIDTTKSSLTLKQVLKSVSDSLALTVSSNIARIILAAVIFAGLLAVGGLYSYNKGLHYEYLKSEDYGALKLAVRVRKYKDPEDYFLKAFLYRKAGKKYRGVEGVELKFKNEPSKVSKKYYHLSSDKLYLESSIYRLIMHVDNELFQKDFYLGPRIIQKKRKETAEYETVQLNHETAGRLPLKANFSISDVKNNRKITRKTDIFINYYKRWIKWPDFVKLKKFKDIFTTGKTYKFKFERDDYYTKFLRIPVKQHQTVLTIEADMAPIPGSLLFKSKHTGLDVLLNNSEHYFTGGKNRKYRKINSATRKYQKLILSPGEYFFTVKKSGITKTVKTTVESKKATRIKINYDSKKESIKLDIREPR